jgi:PiT family inorganic phosphate transporter
MPLVFIFVISLALIFDFLNAVHGSSNIVATMISSGAFRPWAALAITAMAEFLGPFLFGVAVARTIGSVVQANVITIHMLIACLLGTIIWSLLTWLMGIPSSPSHALIGGLIGTALVGVGAGSLQMSGVVKALVGLFIAPLIGFGIGFILMRFVFFLAAGTSPRINEFFKRGQFITGVALAISHGANDAQKAMGIIVLALVIGGFLPGFHIPFWVMLISAAGMGLGTVLAGWKLIRTIGGKFYKIRPVHSFSAQLASTIVLLGSSLIGWPVSATQVISSALIGVGASERFGKVRWSVAGEILIAWVLTIPSSALLSAGIYWLIIRIYP